MILIKATEYTTAVYIHPIVLASVADPDPFNTDPYHFKEVMYLNSSFYTPLLDFSLSEGPTGPTQKVFLVKFSLPLNFLCH
jgi:hypothetical protein